jgi:hypothetical protein
LLRSGTGERRTACRTPPYGEPCLGLRRRSSKRSDSMRTSSCWWLMFGLGNGRGVAAAGVVDHHPPTTVVRADAGGGRWMWARSRPCSRPTRHGFGARRMGRRWRRPWARHAAGHTYVFDELNRQAQGSDPRRDRARSVQRPDRIGQHQDPADPEWPSDSPRRRHASPLPCSASAAKAQPSPAATDCRHPLVGGVRGRGRTRSLTIALKG